jgi:serine/threonine protein kinase
VMFHVGMMTEAPQIPHEFSDEVKLFLRSCLNLEPQERGTADELLGEPFLTVPAPDTPTNLFQRAPTTII